MADSIFDRVCVEAASDEEWLAFARELEKREPWVRWTSGELPSEYCPEGDQPFVGKDPAANLLVTDDENSFSLPSIRANAIKWPAPEVKIGSYTATQSGDGIKVGCTEISREQMEAIAKLAGGHIVWGCDDGEKDKADDAKPARKPGEFRAGDRVMHRTFGPGMVTSDGCKHSPCILVRLDSGAQGGDPNSEWMADHENLTLMEP